MRIAVLGGAGFIGSHLCTYLLQKQHTVLCIDNLYTGSIKNIAHLVSHPTFTYISANSDDWNGVSKKIDQIYNLACPASPIQYQKDPIFTLKTNIFGMFNVLQLAEKYNCKILQASTSEIYGDPLEHPQQEKHWGNVNPIGLRACYDEGKRIAETICIEFYRQKQVQIKLVRIFNTYGPKMQINDGRVISNFIVQALQNKPIIIYGTGKQTRSFCFIDDLIFGLSAMMNTANDFTGPVNLGNPNEISILEIAVKIKNMTNSKSEIIFKTLPEDDPKRRCPDITMAKQYLSWQPEIPLQIGLEKTITYFREELLK